MIEDVHEPVELFKTVFKEAHARHTAEYFEDLLRRSGVDEHANVETVRGIASPRSSSYANSQLLQPLVEGRTGCDIRRWRTVSATGLHAGHVLVAGGRGGCCCVGVLEARTPLIP